MKRGIDEDDTCNKKARVCEESGSGVEKDRILGENEASCCGEPLGLSNGGDVKRNGKEHLDIDLNVIDVENYETGWYRGLQTLAFVAENFEQIILEKKGDVIHITSDDSDGEDVRIVDMNNNAFEGTKIKEGNSNETSTRLSLGLGTTEGERIVENSSDDQGKAEVDDSLLNLSTNPSPVDLERIENALQAARRHREYQRERAARYHEHLRQNAVLYARSTSTKKDQSEEILDQEEKEADEELGSSPFLTALKKVLKKNLKNNKKTFSEWKPLVDNHRKRIAPSLLELSLKVLAENAMALDSLDRIPDSLRRRFVDLLSNQRSMNVRILDLLVEGSPTAIRIKDCHWLKDDQFCTAFGKFDMKNLRVLQLDLCGQVTFDYALRDTFARSINSLPNLCIISLKGAARLSDDAVKTLVRSAPSLRSINLSRCSLVSETGIKYIADSLGSILRELYLDECPKLDALLMIPALMKFNHLEVLSVSGVQSVCDQFVNAAVTLTLKELNVADCLKLTDYSMKLIGSACADLRALNISNLDKVTDLGIEYLATKCKSIEKLKLNGNQFSDEAIAAFLEVSGQSLKELSLNKVSKVSHNTAISLANCSKGLISLDLSWCRRISDEALGMIVDRCSSLKLLKLFGCTQINPAILNGISNSLVRIIGLPNTRVLDSLNILEPEEVLLQYSPLPLPSEF